MQAIDLGIGMLEDEINSRQTKSDQDQQSSFISKICDDFTSLDHMVFADHISINKSVQQKFFQLLLKADDASNKCLSGIKYRLEDSIKVF